MYLSVKSACVKVDVGLLLLQTLVGVFIILILCLLSLHLCIAFYSAGLLVVVLP